MIYFFGQQIALFLRGFFFCYKEKRYNFRNYWPFTYTLIFCVNNMSNTPSTIESIYRCAPSTFNRSTFFIGHKHLKQIWTPNYEKSLNSFKLIPAFILKIWFLTKWRKVCHFIVFLMFSTLKNWLLMKIILFRVIKSNKNDYFKNMKEIDRIVLKWWLRLKNMDSRSFIL